MKVRFSYNAGGFVVDETFSGSTADAIVSAMKNRVASEAGFAVRLMVNSMSPLGFAQEAVRRYNRQARKSLPVPESCEEFLRTGESEGIVRFQEE